MNKYDSYLSDIRIRLDDARYEHTLSVAETARALGELYDLPEEDCDKLYVAGLLHDITKPLTLHMHIALCKKANMPLTKDDLASPPTLHAITGAIVAKRDFPEIADDTVCHAIMRHTTGGCDMNLIDKLLYLADYIEPKRQNPVCIAAREAFYAELAVTDDKIATLHRHMLSMTESTRRYILQKQFPLHPKTDETVTFLKKELEK